MTALYLDMCCLKRPFDDHGQERVRREAAAVAGLIERAERGEIELIRSPALTLENDQNPREDRRLAAALWLNGATVEVPYSDAVGDRARELAALGFSVLDALHVAFAEAARARWMATCDDGLLRRAGEHSAKLGVVVLNPCDIPGGGLP